ncbi:probable galactose-1-phosphate uridylyltransferase [Drosophila sechellia]|uniref:Galactose-1-phosphate uridylyltransferase n=1 Tax=Drosophila sechellia TaxID=7238 RepID=B4HXV8_DROSE|nr:probable galactose-1-phosphate uridylyltransferase [Drosophila sechellia]EDW51888.1 GM14012 [Drosophila sechellia]
MQFVASEHPHRRLNPLNGQWVLVCPHRTQRPWSGQQEKAQKNDLPEFDPTNPLCPGVTRPNGIQTPEYESTYVFENDFPALVEVVPVPPNSDDPLFQIAPARGNCRVMCFHPKSNLTLPTMSAAEIVVVIDEWISQFNELSAKYAWVQIFENKGAAMGCSNPHPHCQIWSCSFLPTEPQLKQERLRAYYATNERPMLADYVERELQRQERIVIENRDWVVVVPFWATWPFETMLISRNNNKRINDLTAEQRYNLALTMKELTTKYDNLFQCSFPYSMGWHGAPTGPEHAHASSAHWTLHAIYYPPLLRSASVRKFMVGFELLAMAQRDLTPEQAAQKLREVDGKCHYLEK